jgi:hypothetical protein
MQHAVIGMNDIGAFRASAWANDGVAAVTSDVETRANLAFTVADFNTRMVEVQVATATTSALRERGRQLTVFFLEGDQGRLTAVIGVDVQNKKVRLGPGPYGKIRSRPSTPPLMDLLDVNRRIAQPASNARMFRRGAAILATCALAIIPLARLEQRQHMKTRRNEVDGCVQHAWFTRGVAHRIFSCIIGHAFVPNGVPPDQNRHAVLS